MQSGCIEAPAHNSILTPTQTELVHKMVLQEEEQVGLDERTQSPLLALLEKHERYPEQVPGAKTAWREGWGTRVYSVQIEAEWEGA